MFVFYHVKDFSLTATINVHCTELKLLWVAGSTKRRRTKKISKNSL